MTSRFRSGITRARHVAVRRIALPVLGTAPLRRSALALARRRFRVGDRLGSVVDRMLIAATPSVDERRASTEALVELFFALGAVTDVDVFVEAGAKEASASLRAIESGFPRVVAFEANPYTHRRFASAVNAAGVDYRHVALSERAGDVTFLVRRNDDGSPIADGQGSLLVRPDHEPGYEEVTVSGVTLDDEVGGGDGRVAMWVDVEGAVAEVLGGGSGVLERTDVMIVEVEAVARWVGQRWLASDVIERLGRSGLRPVGRDMQSRWQYNIVFVRACLLCEDAVDERVAQWRREAPMR